MIIDHLGLFGTIFRPDKAQPPLIVDPDAELVGAVALEPFQAVSRRNPQVFEGVRGIQHVQFSPGDLGDGSKPPNGFAIEQRPGVSVAEAPYHTDII